MKYMPVKGHRGVSRYQNADGRTVYRVQVYAGRDWQTGKRKYNSHQPFTTLKGAIAWQAEQKDRLRRGETFTPSMTPLGQWCDQWLRSLASVSPKTLIGYRDRITWITEEIGDVPISKVTPAMLDRIYADRLRAGYKVSTIRGVHASIKAALQRAVDHDLLRVNPARRARPPADTSQPKVTWTQAQMRYFLSATADDPFWGVIWRFMAETWVRVGELAALTWADVDLDAATVTINHTMSFDGNRKRVVSEKGKTPAAHRTIVLTTELTSRLRHHRDTMRFIGRDVSDTGIVFPAPTTGSWLWQSTVSNALRRACDKAGLPRMTSHGLRHTGGSIAYRARVDGKVLSERLGHSTPAYSLKTYLHTDEDHHRAASDLIGELLDGST